MGAAGHSFAPIRRRPTLIALDAPAHVVSRPGLRSLEFVQRMQSTPLRYPSSNLTLIARLRRPPPPTLLMRRSRATPVLPSSRRSAAAAGSLDLLAPLSSEAPEQSADSWQIVPFGQLNAPPISRNLARLAATPPPVQRMAGQTAPSGGSAHLANVGFDQPAAPALLFVQPQPISAAPAVFLQRSARTPKSNIVQIRGSGQLLPSAHPQASARHTGNSLPVRGIGEERIVSAYLNGIDPTSQLDRTNVRPASPLLQPALSLLQPLRTNVAAPRIMRWSDVADPSPASPASPPGLPLLQPLRTSVADFTESSAPPTLRRVAAARLSPAFQRITPSAEPEAASSTTESAVPLVAPAATPSQPSGPMSRLTPLDPPFVQRLVRDRSAGTGDADDPAAAPAPRPPFAAPQPLGVLQRMLHSSPRPPAVLQRALAALRQPEPVWQSSAFDPASSPSAPAQRSAVAPIWLQPLRQPLIGASPAIQAGRGRAATPDLGWPAAVIGPAIQRTPLAPTWATSAAQTRQNMAQIAPAERMLQRRAAVLEWLQPRSPAGHGADVAPAVQRRSDLWDGAPGSADRPRDAVSAQRSERSAAPQPGVAVQRRAAAEIGTGYRSTATLDQPWPHGNPALVQRIVAADLAVWTQRELPQTGRLQRTAVRSLGPAVDQTSGARRLAAPLALEWIAPHQPASESPAIRSQPWDATFDVRRASVPAAPAAPNAAPQVVAEMPFAAQIQRQSARLLSPAEGEFRAPLLQRLHRLAPAVPNLRAGSGLPLLQRLGASDAVSSQPGRGAGPGQPRGVRISQGLAAPFAPPISTQGREATHSTGMLLLRRYPAVPQQRQPDHPQQITPGRSDRGQNAIQPAQRGSDLALAQPGAASSPQRNNTSPALSAPLPLKATAQRLIVAEHRPFTRAVTATVPAASPAVQRWLSRADSLLFVQRQRHQPATPERDPGHHWPLQLPASTGGSAAERVPASGWLVAPTPAAAPRQLSADQPGVSQPAQARPPVASAESERWRADTPPVQRHPASASSQSAALILVDRPSSFAATPLASPLLQRLRAPGIGHLTAPPSGIVGAQPRQTRLDPLISAAPLTWLSNGWQTPPPGRRAAIQRQLAERLIERASSFDAARPLSGASRSAVSGSSTASALAELPLIAVQPLRGRAWQPTISGIQRRTQAQAAGRDAMILPRQPHSAAFGDLAARDFMSNNINPPAQMLSAPLLQPLGRNQRTAFDYAVQRHLNAADQPAGSPGQPWSAGQASGAGWSISAGVAASGLDPAAQPGRTAAWLRPLALLQRSLAVDGRSTFGAAGARRDHSNLDRPGRHTSEPALAQPLPLSQLLRAALPSVARAAAPVLQRTPAATLASTLISRFPQGVIDHGEQRATQLTSEQAQPLALVQGRGTAGSRRQPWSDGAEAGPRSSVLAQRAADTSLDLLQPARAAQPGPAPLQRALSEDSTPNHGGLASGADQSDTTDIEALARQVYSRLRRRLRIEAERLGK